MGSQCSFSRRDVERWWLGAKRMSHAAKFRIFWRGWITELGVSYDNSYSSQAMRGYYIGSNMSLGCVFSKKPAD